MRNRQSRRNLKTLSLRGGVEKQAQHGPDRMNKLRAESDEDQSARPRSVEEAGEPDPQGADRELEVYAPSLVGRNSVRVSVRCSYVSIKVPIVLVSTHYQALYKSAL